MSRKRGRIILVGVIGLELNRADFYEKELTFQVSCSYGPGRYDENYEQKGMDYPLPFVRWTEKRNFETILQAIANGQLKVNELISEIVDFQDFQKIYGNIGNTGSIASILKYPAHHHLTSDSSIIELSKRNYSGAKGVIGVIGAGNFTKMTMLPALKGSGAQFKTISSANGLSGTLLAKKYDFSHSTTDNKNDGGNLFDIAATFITNTAKQVSKFFNDPNTSSEGVTSSPSGTVNATTTSVGSNTSTVNPKKVFAIPTLSATSLSEVKPPMQKQLGGGKKKASKKTSKKGKGKGKKNSKK
jgi:hypothetical protein